MSNQEIALPRGADQKHCFSCGRVIHATAAACPTCGASQNASMPTMPPPINTTSGNIANKAFCRGCGQTIHAAAPTCPSCGVSQKTFPTQYHSSKNKTTAALLAFFLGGFGAHKFYLGQIGWGLLYLVFCWTFIPAGIAFIEGIIYLSTSDEKFERQYY